MQKIFILMFLLLNSVVLFAKNVETCGTVEKIAGDTCKTTSIQFNLKGCEHDLGVEDAKVSCGEKEISATFKSKKYNYRLILTQASTWGRSTLSAKGKIWRAVRKAYLETDTTAPAWSKQEVIPNANTVPSREVAKENIVPENLTFHIAGIFWTEFESTRRFGFDGSSGVANFSSSKADQYNMNLNARLSMDVGADKTRLYSLFDLGEIYYGDENTGGQTATQGTDNIFLRNLYIEHTVNDNGKVAAGLLATAFDPRGFIYNDDLASVRFSCETERSASKIIYGEGHKSRPSDATVNNEKYLGLSSTLKLKENTLTPFAAYRNIAGEAFEDQSATPATGVQSEYYWAGLHSSINFGQFVMDGSVIYNYGKSTFANISEDDTYNSYLFNLRFQYSPKTSKVSYTIEGLITPGAENVADGSNKIIGRRKSFSSVADTSYLLTIATSDGLDEAPGSKKELVPAGGLGTNEGLRIIVARADYNLSDETSMFLRYGHIQSAVKSANDSTHIGDEVDFEITHKLSARTTAQLDLAYLGVGKFFGNNAKDASLIAAKYRFEF